MRDYRTLSKCPFIRSHSIFGNKIPNQIAFSLIHDEVTFFIIAYAIGGTFNHAATLAMHECSHNLAFGNVKFDRWLGIFVNLILGIPSAQTFRRYHLEHHQYQGVDGLDTDLPTNLEGVIVKKCSPLRKALWMLIQPALYSLRPVFVNPKNLTLWELVNIVIQLTFDAGIYYFFGIKALVYLVASTLLGMGIHPLAAHFIAEHYVSNPGQETYSYYGPLNIVSFNVGYHNEHHDFANIPGSRLPQLRKIAPEFYDNLVSYDSWVQVLYWYIFNPQINPYSRIKRTKADHDSAKRSGHGGPQTIPCYVNSSTGSALGADRTLSATRKEKSA
eukprot:GEZU01016702.1.p1 GENE.GEZU01016702.1~~GEZU01016702.1.p1  ORF type:complete len:330 (-),score=62.51 GEZU01016702.1:140-1129(-)